MTGKVERLCAHRVFHHFYQICQIPHPSGGEKPLSDFLLSWARGLGLDVEQDGANNVLIRKPASPGREGSQTVMLQAHMDMVCEKATGVDHDFSKDPICWVVEDDLLSTGGRTTLGADDGIGVAMAMAILEDNTLIRPPLEVLFTVNEEDDFSGVIFFDVEKMRARRLINLDHTVEHELLCGSCGGMQTDFYLPVVWRDAPEQLCALSLRVEGLKGGHSGDDIHRGRGSANQLLIRLLAAAEGEGLLYLSHLKGGTFRLAIPREAEAVLCVPADRKEAVCASVTRLAEEMKRELPGSAEGLQITLTDAERPERCVAAGPILTALSLLPDGVCQMNELFEGQVDTSCNLGELYLREDCLHTVTEIRSARTSLGEWLFQRMERLAELLGGACTRSNPYPSWDFQPDSTLRQVCTAVHEDLYGTQPRYLTVHAGLEVGCFFDRRPDIDAVALGPNAWDFHSPSERLSVSSTLEVYRYLCAVLKALG